MSELELNRLVDAAAFSNAKLDVTGALAVVGQTFFQILEGPDASVDALFAKIRADRRHTDVTCLDAHANHEIRLFPLWSMRRVRQTASGTTVRIASLITELPTAPSALRKTLSDEIAILMRSALRAA